AFSSCYVAHPHLHTFPTRRSSDLQFGRGRGGAPGPGRMEGATLIELDRDVILKDLVPMLVERHFPANDQSGYRVAIVTGADQPRSEEHTSELQSRFDLVCRLLLEK